MMIFLGFLAVSHGANDGDYGGDDGSESPNWRGFALDFNTTQLWRNGQQFFGIFLPVFFR